MEAPATIEPTSILLTVIPTLVTTTGLTTVAITWCRSHGAITHRHRVTTSRRRPITGLIRFRVRVITTAAAGMTDRAVPATTVGTVGVTGGIAMIPAGISASGVTGMGATGGVITEPVCLSQGRCKPQDRHLSALMRSHSRHSDLCHTRSANGCRPSHTLLKCASTTAAGTWATSGQCQRGLLSLSSSRARTPSLNSG